MLLQEIVREFDAELMRLASLREIVAGLGSPRIQVLESEIHNLLLHPPTPPMEEPVNTVSETDTSSAPAKRTYTRRAAAGEVVRRSARRRHVEAGAIASAIPAGPVVVSAAALERQRQRPANAEAPAGVVVASAKPALTPESSNDLARTLAQRWLSGESASF